mmetsp:Transcript_15983/g.17897  ORF Transcript_15983/g.17897 Transcript_15983/m.17897 type:complete len:87 (+) Transcript_15983:128-388(+)
MQTVDATKRDQNCRTKNKIKLQHYGTVQLRRLEKVTNKLKILRQNKIFCIAIIMRIEIIRISITVTMTFDNNDSCLLPISIIHSFK